MNLKETSPSVSREKKSRERRKLQYAVLFTKLNGVVLVPLLKFGRKTGVSFTVG